MPVLIGDTFAITITMASPIATATTTRSVVTTRIGLMRCASARSGGGIYMTSSAAGVGANCSHQFRCDIAEACWGHPNNDRWCAVAWSAGYARARRMGHGLSDT